MGSAGGTRSNGLDPYILLESKTPNPSRCQGARRGGCTPRAARRASKRRREGPKGAAGLSCRASDFSGLGYLVADFKGPKKATVDMHLL